MLSFRDTLLVMVTALGTGCFQHSGPGQSWIPGFLQKNDGELKTMQAEFCSGPVKITIDPTIGVNPSIKESADNWKIICQDSTSQNVESAPDFRSIQPTDYGFLNGLDPNRGDPLVEDIDESLRISAYQFNSPQQTIKFIGGVIFVRPRGPAEMAFNKLRERYNFQTSALQDGLYSMTLDLDRVSLENISTAIDGLRHPNGELLRETVFSSINAAKLVKVYSEIQKNYHLLFESVELNTFGDDH